MGVWNIHAALNFAFLLQQNIIYCKVVLEWMPKYEYYATKCLQDSFQRLYGGTVSYVWIDREQSFHIAFSMIIKRQSEKMPLVDGRTQTRTLCMLFFNKDQLPIHTEGGVAIWQFWLSKHLSADVLVSQHGPKWIDLLIVPSSYCNTICSMACHRRDLTVRIEF